MVRLFSARPDFVVRVTPRIFSTAHDAIVDLICPQARSIDRSFVDSEFNISVEAMLALEPTMILSYGAFERKGLQNVSIPLADLHLKEMDPEKLTTRWEAMLAEAFHVDNPEKLSNLWAESNQKVEKLKASATGKPVRALMLFSNMAGVIKVSGANSYGGEFLEKAGLVNVAASVSAGPGGSSQVVVSMEQINQWNPDVIYVAMGVPASALKAGTVEGQDWSHLGAVRKGRVYDVPRGMYCWAMPYGDSPLMPLWLMSTLVPEAYSQKDFVSDMKTFYNRLYGVELPDELAAQVLSPRRPGRP